MARNIFIYGTLMFDAVLSRVITGRYRQTVAFARGYRRLKVNHENYPALVPVKGALPAVQGIVLHRVCREDIKKLDAFEGDCYQRKAIVVYDEQQREIPADVYLIHPRHLNILSCDEWDVSAFAADGINRFVAEYCSKP